MMSQQMADTLMCRHRVLQSELFNLKNHISTAKLGFMQTEEFSEPGVLIEKEKIPFDATQAKIVKY